MVAQGLSIVRKNNYLLMEAITGNAPREIILDRNLTLLKIKANAGDPVLFQTYFCVDDASFVLVGGLFPSTSRLHAQHKLAWLPTIDENMPGQPINHIAHWLENTVLDRKRLAWLSQVAPTTSTLNWVWVLNEAEYKGWTQYLDNHLEELAESWLKALNGVDSPLLTAQAIWQAERPSQTCFKWSEAS